MTENHGIIVGLILLIGLLLWAQSSFAEATYCNMQGNTKVCNTYSDDGSGKTDTTYTNTYGNTTIENDYSNSYQ